MEIVKNLSVISTWVFFLCSCSLTPTINAVANLDPLEKPEVYVSSYSQRHTIMDREESIDKYEVFEGSTVNISCVTNHISTMRRRISWNLPHAFTNQSGNHALLRDMETNVHITRTLIMTQLNHETDSGEYTCRLEFRDGRTRREEVQKIIIEVIPNDSYNVAFMLEEPEIKILPGKNASLTIKYSANPKPEFTWRRGGELLANSSHPKAGTIRHDLKVVHKRGYIDLTLGSPSAEDIGVYTVEGVIEENGEVLARDEVSFNLTMPVPPSQPAIEFYANDAQVINRTLPQNSDFNVTCKSTGYPKPHLTLKFQQCFSKNNCTEFKDINMEDEDKKNLLQKRTFNPTEKSFVTETGIWEGKALVQGYYRCTAVNNLTGENPEDNLKGKKPEDKKAFVVGDGSLEFLDIKTDINGDEGKWESKAVHVVEADNVTVLCQGSKILTSSLEWKINGSLLGSSNSSSKYRHSEKETNVAYLSEIKIERVSMEDNNMILSCSDTSDSTLETEIRVNVSPMVPPVWLTNDDPLQDRNLEEMGNLTLSCPIHGVPMPAITWYKDDEPLDESIDDKDSHRLIRGHEIVFSFLKTSDSGKYRCEASNRNGTIASEAYISVTDPDAYANSNIFIVSGILSSMLIFLSIFICIKMKMNKDRAYRFRLEEQRMFEEGSPENLNPELGLEEQAELLPYDTKYEVSRDSIVLDKLLGAGSFGRVYRAKVSNLIPGQPQTIVAVKMMKSRSDSAQLKALRSEVKILIHIGRHVNIVNLLGACSKEFASKGEMLLLVEYCQHGNILDFMRRKRKDFINQINEKDKINPSISVSRMRQRSESGSRNGTTKPRYAHLNFDQEQVTYTIESSAPRKTLWLGPLGSSTTADSDGSNGHYPDTCTMGTTLGSSGGPVGSDMSNLTFENTGSGSDNGYRAFRGVSTSLLPLCSKDLLSWAYQIAKGMEYLAFKKVLHGDLAARNILLAEDNVVKISDFGLAKDIYKNDYKKKSKTPLPWKWLAVECFRDGVFSTQSDIWSYGVVLWEIFSLGQSPYPGLEFDENFVKRLEKGVRPDQPKYATYDLYRIMLDCWVLGPMERPSFSKLESTLGMMIGDAERQHILDLNQDYEMENTASTFISILQSPDYTAKIRERNMSQSEDYEVHSSHSPIGATVSPTSLTPVHMQYTSNGDMIDDDALSDQDGSVYVPMASPTKATQNFFNFDEKIVEAITMTNFSDEECPNEDNYLSMECSSSPDKCPSSKSQSDNVMPHHKFIRASLVERQDSGIYSPGADMQNNPHYVVMDQLLNTNEKNSITNDVCNSPTIEEPNYINIADEKPKGLKKDCSKDYSVQEDCGYSPLYEKCKRRTVSETSSGLGSISEESPFENSYKGDPIMEEPICV